MPGVIEVSDRCHLPFMDEQISYSEFLLMASIMEMLTQLSSDQYVSISTN